MPFSVETHDLVRRGMLPKTESVVEYGCLDRKYSPRQRRAHGCPMHHEGDLCNLSCSLRVSLETNIQSAGMGRKWIDVDGQPFEQGSFESKELRVAGQR